MSKPVFSVGSGNVVSFFSKPHTANLLVETKEKTTKALADFVRASHALAVQEESRDISRFAGQTFSVVNSSTNHHGLFAAPSLRAKYPSVPLHTVPRASPSLTR